MSGLRTVMIPFLAVAILLACAPVARETTELGVTDSGQEADDIRKKEITESEGPVDFSAISLHPSSSEEYTLPNRKQYNYLFRGAEGERHWLFLEIAQKGGFGVMGDAEFLDWVRGANGMQDAILSDLDIRQRDTHFGPIKYSYYFALGHHCVGLAGIFGDPRDVEGYPDSRSSAIYGEFCRQNSSPREVLLFSDFVIDRLRIRAPTG